MAGNFWKHKQLFFNFTVNFALLFYPHRLNITSNMIQKLFVPRNSCTTEDRSKECNLYF